MQDEDESIINAYREAFRRYAKDGVIDMDYRLKHRFNFQIHRLEDFLRKKRESWKIFSNT
jgi:hypothetical protein